MNKSMKTMTILMLAVVAMAVVGCTKPDEPDNGDHGGNDDIPTDTIAYVDLGLSSGTLWATRNVGASCPEDCGDYYAWGETVTKKIYDWKSYKYCTFDGERYLMTKYCSEPSCGWNGFVDSLTVLEPLDDVVSANWGASWRMPTKAEMEELNQETTFIWTTLNGVEGRLLTGPNGNTIFFPATGFYLDDGVICKGLGIYWSNSQASQVSAWSLHFDYENCHVCATYERNRGHCVRGVRVGK